MPREDHIHSIRKRKIQSDTQSAGQLFFDDEEEDDDNEDIDDDDVDGLDDDEGGNYYSIRNSRRTNYSSHPRTIIEQDRMGLVTNNNPASDSDDLSGSMEQVILQNELYERGESEKRHPDTVRCVKSYLKKVYRQVKFFSDSQENFQQPNFVQKDMETQTVQICNWILKQLGK